MEDKRKSRRYKFNLKSFCTLDDGVSGKPAVFTFSIQDMSRTGLLFLGQGPIPIGSKIKIFLKYFGQEFSFYARIARCEEMFGGTLYETGVFFTDLSPEQQGIIDKILTD